MGNPEKPPPGDPRPAGPRREKIAPVPWPPDSFVRDLISRLVVIALCLGVGYALWRLGHNIIKTGVYDYTLETSSGDGSSMSNEANVKREHVHETGSWAKEQGTGFEVVGVTLAFWAAIILWGMAGPLALKSAWSPLHSLLTLISLAGCGTAVFFFFPPWRLGWTMSGNASYMGMAAFLYLATIRDRDKVKKRSQKLFPALIGSAVVIGMFSSGYGIGIIAGIFIGILLATHILLLIPKMRAELWTPGEKSWSQANR